MYCLFCDVLCIVCVYMCTELLPPGGYSIAVKYSVIQKDVLNFVRLYFLNYTWYVNDLHNI